MQYNEYSINAKQQLNHSLVIATQTMHFTKACQVHTDICKHLTILITQTGEDIFRV